MLDRLPEPAADDVKVRCAEREAPIVRRYTATRYGTSSSRCERRVAARIEAGTMGLDIRYAATTPTHGSAERLYAGANWLVLALRDAIPRLHAPRHRRVHHRNRRLGVPGLPLNPKSGDDLTSSDLDDPLLNAHLTFREGVPL